MQDQPDLLTSNMDLTLKSGIQEQEPGSAAAKPSPSENPSTRRWRWNVIQVYKEWVRAHPGIVSNLDWLLYLTVWNPARTASPHSELTYEAYHALVGLLSVWHQHVIDEVQAPLQRPAAAVWLDALEQVETIIELRAMHLEHHGRLNRYGPLTALEVCKALLKMCMWAQYPGHLFLRHPGPEDLDQFDSEQGLADVLAALERLRLRYTGNFAHAQRNWWNPVAWLSNSSSDTDKASAAGCQAAASRQAQVLHGGKAVACGIGGGVRHVSPEVHMGVNLMWTAELLHIWRPVVYVVLLKRHGRQSWHPWTTSLVVDVLSMYFTHRGKALMQSPAVQQGPHMAERGQAGSSAGGWPAGIDAPMRGSKPHSSLLSLALARHLSKAGWSSGETRELAERRRKLALYLLRSPALDLLLKPLAERVRHSTARVPLLKHVTDYVAGLLDTFTVYYTYTSGSS